MEEVQQPNPCNISLVEDIPYELQIRIVTFLNLKTVTAIARTCKALYKVVKDDWAWKGLLVHRYGSKVLPASNEDISYLDIYKRISYPELLIADNFDIIHNNDPYWKTITIKGNDKSINVAWLNHVCWLHLEGTMNRIEHGAYKVVWLLYTGHTPYNLDDITFHADVVGQQVNDQLESKFASTILYNQSRNGLKEYVMPGTLNVKPDDNYADVKLYVQDHSNQWKVNIGFVAVKLVPAYKTRNDKENSETEENLDANDSSDLAFFSNMDIGSTIDEQDEHDEHNERNGQDESEVFVQCSIS